MVQLAPEAPTNLTATLGSNITVKLTWEESSSNVTAFVIERKVEGGAWGTVNIVPFTADSYSDQLDQNFGQFGTVYYRVLAANNSLESAYSNIASVTLTEPSAPQGLALYYDDYSGKDGIQLTWISASPYITDYFKILRTAGNGTQESIGSTNDTYYIDTNLDDNTLYTYEVEVIGYYGAAFSDKVQYKTPAKAVVPAATGTAITGSASTAAVDVSSASDWAEEEIKEAYALDLTTDTILNHFNRNITREEFCEIAVKLYEALSGQKALVAIVNPFNDTSNSTILKAYELGIIKGTSDTTFSPDNPITRQEICVMIYRTLKADNPKLDKDITGVSAFSDEASIASWAIDAVKYANKNGIMKGTGGNKISPLDNTSREQAIVLLKRTYENFQ